MLVWEVAALAQLVEQHFCKVKVPSSNLGSGSKKFDLFKDLL